MGLAYCLGVLTTPDTLHPSYLSDWMQFHAVTVGALGGAFGASIAPALAQLLAQEDSNDHIVRIAVNVVTGVFLPRLALALDQADSAIWNLIGRLSS